MQIKTNMAVKVVNDNGKVDANKDEHGWKGSKR